MKKVHILSLGLILTMSIATGCSKPALENQSGSDQNMPAASDTASTESKPDSDASSSGPSDQALGRSDSAGNLGSVDEAIYFDFDSDMLDAEDQDVLRFKAEWLKGNPQVRAMLIEGHCDERGTDAYNMALGARRAETVKAYLLNLGVAGNKLNTQSYGEEKPAVADHNEAAWTQNRRASFVVN